LRFEDLHTHTPYLNKVPSLDVGMDIGGVLLN